jgi:hypothetical protein
MIAIPATLAVPRTGHALASPLLSAGGPDKIAAFAIRTGRADTGGMEVVPPGDNSYLSPSRALASSGTSTECCLSAARGTISRARS